MFIPHDVRPSPAPFVVPHSWLIQGRRVARRAPSNPQSHRQQSCHPGLLQGGSPFVWMRHGRQTDVRIGRRQADGPPIAQCTHYTAKRSTEGWGSGDPRSSLDRSKYSHPFTAVSLPMNAMQLRKTVSGVVRYREKHSKCYS